MLLEVSKEPYLIDVEPGVHELLFTDPKSGSKKVYSKVAGALVGGAFGIALGGSALAGAALGANSVPKSDMNKGYLCVTLNEGDVLKISAQATRKGNVKLKMLKG